MGRRLLTQVARVNRKKGTLAEEYLWEVLRAKNLDGQKFRRQNVIGQFIVDFCCPDAKLIIELDGGIHDSREAQIADTLRTEFLNTKGYTVIRFRNEQVLNNRLEVINTIRKNLPIIQTRKQ